MPLPTGLVVKNGSNTFCKTSGGIPVPVSDTRIATKSPVVRFIVQPDVLGADPDRAAVGHGVPCVDDKVDQSGFEFGDVDLDRPDVVLHVDGELNGAADAGVENLAHGLDAFAQTDGLRIDVLPPRKGQELAGQRGPPPRGRFDRFNGAPGFFVVGIFLQDLGAAADHHQKVVEVMGDAAGQLPQRIELLGFGELLLHALQLERGLAPLGDVARDLGKADQPAILLDGVDDDAGPEERAVLADAPAFLFVTAVLPGDAERPRGLAVALVGRGVKPRKMLPDDLLRQVTLDSLPADIPARHNALRVEHIKRVIGNPLDQQPETALALEKILIWFKSGHLHPNREKRSYAETVPKKDEAPKEGAAPGYCLIFNGFTSTVAKKGSDENRSLFRNSRDGLRS